VGMGVKGHEGKMSRVRGGEKGEEGGEEVG